jgi:formate/nitrite transporter FocA (FNT family)
MTKVSLPWQQAFVRGILCNWLLSLVRDDSCLMFLL